MSTLRALVKKVTPKFIKKIYRKIKPSPLSKFYREIEGMPTKEVFTKIKDNNIWGSSESVSGRGSELHQTKILIQELPKLFKNYNIRTIIDIPCGDFNWMSQVDLSTIDYIGADIVDELISENQKRYNSKNINFFALDLITDILPQRDLIFTRDCLVHLSFADIQKAITNIKKSGCKYLFTTTFVDYHDNEDIITGQWRAINLQDKPFNFPQPEYVLLENCTEGDGRWKNKAMGLWLIEKI
jgi:hypothetical protein